MDLLLKHIDSGGQVDVIFTDFTKAFDTIQHDILRHILNYFDFPSKSMFLILSYLRDRIPCLTQFLPFLRNLCYFRCSSRVPS